MRPATVFASKTSRGVKTRPADFARETSWIDMIESPPRPKKESSTPILPRPSTSAKRSARTASVAVAGARVASVVPVTVKSGAGRLRRSSFPLTVSGSDSRTTIAVGTMYSASSAATKSVTVAESTVLPVSATTYPTIRGDAPSVRTSATEAATPGQRSIAASISPSSMRKPRTFTWKSLRPTYSNCPASFHLARSPLRYIRSPELPNGSGRNRTEVNAGFPRYPRVT